MITSKQWFEIVRLLKLVEYDGMKIHIFGNEVIYIDDYLIRCINVTNRVYINYRYPKCIFDENGRGVPLTNIRDRISINGATLTDYFRFVKAYQRVCAENNGASNYGGANRNPVRNIAYRNT